MLHALSLLIVLSILALWSLGAWALHSIAIWSASNAGRIAGDRGSVEGIAMPGWLAPWIPSEWLQAFTSMLSALKPAMAYILDLAPAAMGGVTTGIWILWGLGCIFLIAVGGALHKPIATLARRQSRASAAGL